jgi:ribosomal protein L9
MPSEEEMKAEIERLRAENETLKKPARGQLSLKVSEKGALSVYGMAMSDQIREFIQANDATLKKKE